MDKKITKGNWKKKAVENENVVRFERTITEEKIERVTLQGLIDEREHLNRQIASLEEKRDDINKQITDIEKIK